MVWLPSFILFLNLVSIHGAPLHPTDAGRSKLPEASKEFATVFRYTLEACGAFTRRQASELHDSILMLTNAVEEFPRVTDIERILLEATAATIARTVVEYADEDGGLFNKVACVDKALKNAFKMTTGKPDHSFITEVERMIEIFFFEQHHRVSESSSYSYSSESYSSSYFDDESYDSTSVYEELDSYYDDYSDEDNGDYYREDYLDGGYDNIYNNGEYFNQIESPGYYVNYESPRYLEYPNEKEYLGDYEPNLNYGLYNEDYGFYEDVRRPIYIERPEFYELVPIEYDVMQK